MGALAVGMLLGLLFVREQAYVSYVILIIAITFAIGLIIYEVRCKLKIIYILISAICIIISFVLGGFRYYCFLSDKAYFDNINDGDTITCQGKLAYIEKKPTSYNLYFNNIYINDLSFDHNISIILKSDSDDTPIGTTAVITADKIQFNNARNEGNYDEQSYYNSLGTVCKVQGTIVESYEPGFSLQDMLYRFRKMLTSVIADNLPGEESGIMSAMSLGDKGDLDTQTKDLFKLSGLAHILAISGLHVSIVGMSIYRLLRKRGINYHIAGIVSSIIVIMYGMLTDGGVSTVRAIGMFLIMILANIIGHSYDMLTAIAVLAMYILLLYPYSIDSVGFVFSFGAVIGIAVVVSPITGVYDKYIRLRFLERHKGEDYRPGIKDRLIKALLSGMLIQLVTLPIVCFYYYEIPTYVVLINLIVIPLLCVLLGTSLIGALCGVIALTGVFIISGIFSLICEMCFYVSHIILYLYELLASNSLKLPFARIITGRPSVVEIIIYYVVLLALSRYILAKSRDMEHFIKRDYVSYRRRFIACIIGTVALVISITSNDNRLGFEMDMLDVGQGDGIYIGGGDVNYFFDGGSSDIKSVGAYRILPFLKYKGIRHIDYWFVSHVDSDHISGLIEVLEASYPIDYIVVDSYMIGESNYDDIKTAADRNGTEILVMNVGDEILADVFTIRCIFSGDDSIDDINANSLVLLGEYRDGDSLSRVLIGGDMTTTTEKLILSDASEDELDVDILKVAHHGSKTSSSPEFIRALTPDMALISAGVNNRYGHPHGVTLDTLEDAGCDIYRTDLGGRILVDIKSKEVAKY